MGAIFNAQANHSPLLITAGQQVRPAITMQANLTNRDAARMPHPLVKWSYEVPRAADVPAAIGRAIHTASLPPKGPAFVSIPMDDWTAEADEEGSARAFARRVDGRAGAAPDRVADLARRIAAARNPVLVAGPDIDARAAWDHAVASGRAAEPAGLVDPRDRRRPARLPREPRQLPRASCRRRSARSPRRSPATT